MKNVLRFWLARGVDGFRIDTIPNLIEDDRFLDEPKIPNTGLPDTDPGTLNHIYTYNQNETYDVLKSWRDDVLDKSPGGKKLFLTEAWTDLDHLIKFYRYGSNIPFNFMFLGDLNNRSTTLDIKRTMNKYLNAVPEGELPNWVVGNHDKDRVSWRFGSRRADWISMIAAVLPGVGVIYNGDEIGMENRPMSWEETVDPAGCNAGPDRYQIYSRDPARTPFQWDDTVSAGFSTNRTTWLPVHSNYKTLNLERQKQVNASHYTLFKELVKLKRHPVVRNGETEIIVAPNSLGFVRRVKGQRPVVLILAMKTPDDGVFIDFSAWLNIPETMEIYDVNYFSQMKRGQQVDTTRLHLLDSTAVILV